MANFKGLAIGVNGGYAETETEFRGGLVIPPGQYLRFSVVPTAAPSTGLDQWDLFVIANNGGTGAQLALCVTGNTLVYSTFDTSTLGRTT